MPETALNMVRELGRRMEDLVLATPSSGTTTTLVDADLQEYLPHDIPAKQLNCWVYGCQDVVADNRGIERRGKEWDVDTFTLTFYNAWPAAVTTAGTYEVRRHHQRSRATRALNSAIAQLGLYWYREVIDTSLTTAAETWQYTLPSSQNWFNVTRVEIQSQTDATLEAQGFPYDNAYPLGWTTRRAVTSAGVETLVLQFSTIPPEGRKLRVYGEAYHAAIDDDTDVLALSGRWEPMALEWIYDYGVFSLMQWREGRASGGDMEKVRTIGLDRLMRSKERILEQAPVHGNARVLTPFDGDGTRSPRSPNERRMSLGLSHASWR